MKKDYIISIIIPIYNTEEYIGDCIQSIQSQSFQNYEIICIDDKSTDSSWQSIKSLAESDDRIHIYQNECNRGLSYTRNKGIELAKGEYICFLDSDDFLKENALECMFGKMEKSRLDMLLFDYEFFFEPGVIPIERPIVENLQGLYGVYDGPDLFIRMINESRYFFYACCKIYRRRWLLEKKIRFREGIYHEDYLFYVDCMLNAKRVACLSIPLYHYRRRKGQITTKSDSMRLQSFFYTFMEILHYWRDGGYPMEIQYALGSLADYVFQRMLAIRNKRNSIGECQLGTDADKYIYSLLQNAEFKENKYIHLTKKQWDIILSYDTHYIYGAGNYGKELYEILLGANLYVDSFLVTDETASGNLLYGKRIIPIDQWNYDPDGLIIIAGSKRNRDEIAQRLESEGYDNYLKLDTLKDITTLDYLRLPLFKDKVVFFDYGTDGHYTERRKLITEEIAVKNLPLDIVWVVSSREVEAPNRVRKVLMDDREAVCREAVTASFWFSSSLLPDFLQMREGQIYIDTKEETKIIFEKIGL